LSPTSESVSPLRKVKDALLTAATSPWPCPKVTARSETSSNTGSVMRSGEGLARVESVADRLTHKNQKGQHARDHKKAGQAQPGRLEIFFALAQEFAQRGRARRHA